MKNGTPEIFVDTNVLFSSVYGSINCEKLINLCAAGKIEIIISELVLEETVRNIKQKIPHSLPAFTLFINNYQPRVTQTPKLISKSVKLLVLDKKDQPIFQSAVNAKVDTFVTGNTKYFKVKQIEKKLKIKVLTPKQAVDKLKL